MNLKMFYSKLGFLSLIVLALAGCVEGAAGNVSYDSPLQPTAQAAQFYQDVYATQTARAIMFESDLRNVQATAEAATQAAIYQQTQAAIYRTETAQAWQAQATQEAFIMGTTQTAIVQSTLDAQATAHAAMALTSTAWPMTATPLSVTQAAILRMEDEAKRRAKWESYTTPLETILPPVLLALVVILIIIGLVLAYKRLMPVLELRLRTIPRGEHDAPLILFPGLVVDPDRNFGPALLIGANGATSTGHAPALELQAGVTMRDQAIDLVRGLPRDNRERREAQRMAANLIPGKPALEAGSELIDSPALPIPAWRMMDNWRGGALPLGMGEHGLILADPEMTPHLLVAGTSGSGKTRYGLRPLITSALADGWQVAIFDRSGLDFLPFIEHENCKVITLDDPAQAIGYLGALYAEIQRRFIMLRQAGASTWGRLRGAGPRVLAVFDEFSNLADSLPNDQRESLWRGARMVAAEGRKAGIHLALALQDPSHRSIDLRIRRNCTALSFRVKDDSASRLILGASGAESLPDRQFLAVMGVEIIRGAAFAPEDGEIETFLDAHTVNALPELAWLELPAQAQATAQDDTSRRIRELKAAGRSMNAIQDEIFGYRGGAAYAAVKAAIDDTTTIE